MKSTCDWAKRTELRARRSYTFGTLAWTGGYGWVSLCVLLTVLAPEGVSGWLIGLGCIMGLLLLWTVYLISVLGVCEARLRRDGGSRLPLWIWTGASMTGVIVLCRFELGFSALLLGIGAVILLLPLSGLGGRGRGDWWYGIGAGVSELAGVLIVNGILVYMAALALFLPFFLSNSGFAPQTITPLIQVLAPLKSWGLLLILAAGAGLGVIGLNLRGKWLARLAGVEFRSLWKRPVIGVLWSLAALTYLASLGLSQYAESRYRATLLAAESELGGALTADALGKRYFAGQKPDAEAWQKVIQAVNTIQNKLSSPNAYAEMYVNPVRYVLSEKDLQECEKMRKDFAGEERVIDDFFERGIPKYPLDLRARHLTQTLLPYLSTTRSLARYDLWRMRLALERGDKAAALAAYHRIQALETWLRGEVTLIGHLVRIAIGSLRSRGTGLLLESGLLTDAELIRMRDDFAALRKQTRDDWRWMLGNESIFALDFYEMLGGGDSIMDNMTPVYSINYLGGMRFLLPQIYGFLRADMANTLRAYRLASANPGMSVPTSRRSPGQWVRPAFDAAYDRLLRRDAMFCAWEAQIDLELARRATGKFPDALPDSAPPDPFTNRKLHYEIGDRSFTMILPSPPPRAAGVDSPLERIEQATAVAVWSEGANGRDDGGFTRSDRSGSDDETAIRRLRNPRSDSPRRP